MPGTDTSPHFELSKVVASKPVGASRGELERWNFHVPDKETALALDTSLVRASCAVLYRKNEDRGGNVLR